jgi:hypothetical protein
MQTFITTVFSRKTVRICLVINEIDLEIRSKQSSATSSERITWLNNQREGIVRVERDILPVQKSDLTQLCEWIKDTEEQYFSFEDITGFLNFWIHLETDNADSGRPTNIDFLVHQLCSKYFLTVPSLDA